MSRSTFQRARRGIFREWRIYTLSVFSLAVAFVCLGAALLFVVNLEQLEDRWSNSGRLTVYLKDGLADRDREALQKALTHTDGVAQVTHVSREDAQRSLDGSAGLESLPIEAFPEALEVTLSEKLQGSRLDAIKVQLARIPGVDEVEGYEAWTARLSKLTRGGVVAAGLLALVVLGAVLAVVSSTIRLALQRRRSEVEVLRLVGATDRYIKGPFVFEGSMQGTLGAFCALVLLGALFGLLRMYTDTELFTLLGTKPIFLPWIACLGLMALGGAMGALASLLGLRRWVVA